MAVFLPGPVASAIAGSIGGTVFSHNRGGAYMRGRTIPVNPQTPAQSAARQALAAANAAWTAVSFPNKIMWDEAAQEMSQAEATNKVGASITLTGAQFYMRINTTSLYHGGPVIATPPVTGVNGGIETFLAQVILIGTTTVTVTLDELPALDANEVFDFFSTPPRSSGALAVRTNAMRFIVSLPTPLVPADLYTGLIGKWLGFSVGQRVGMGVRIRDTVTGAFGPTTTSLITPVAA